MFILLQDGKEQEEDFDLLMINLGICDRESTSSISCRSARDKGDAAIGYASKLMELSKCNLYRTRYFQKSQLGQLRYISRLHTFTSFIPLQRWTSSGIEANLAANTTFYNSISTLDLTLQHLIYNKLPFHCRSLDFPIFPTWPCKASKDCILVCLQYSKCHPAHLKINNVL